MDGVLNMISTILRAEVDDYDKWRKAFDEAIDFRESGGEKSHQVFRGVKNPNEYVLMLEWESVEKFEEYMSSSELKEKFREAGVKGEHVIYILEKD